MSRQDLEQRAKLDLHKEANEILDRMYAAKTEDEWKSIMKQLTPLKEIATERGDNKWLESVQKRVDKQRQFKQPYWERLKNKNQFQSKPKMMFSEETDRAIGDFFRIASEYLKLKMN